MTPPIARTKHSIARAGTPVWRRSEASGISARVGYLVLALASLLAACSPSPSLDVGDAFGASDATTSACAVALLEHQGESDADGQIREYQSLARGDQGTNPERHRAWLERLGWAYVSAARSEQDEGFLLLAEQTASCLQQSTDVVASLPPALLLLGHVRHQQHRFADAERIARHLVRRRGHWLDHALLGDVLLERGDLAGARDAYQRLADLRPGPQAYQRAGELRWFHGDVEGAYEMLARALRALKTGDGGALATLAVRVSALQWQLGHADAALHTLAELEQVRAEFAPAQYLRGRIHLSQGNLDAAIPLLRAAVDVTELPAHRWALIDALRQNDQPQLAAHEQARLLASPHDGRSIALYLATQGQAPARAQALAVQELQARRDPLSLSVAAFAALQAGDLRSAEGFGQEAAAFHLRDARVCLHGALLSQRLLRPEALREQLACVRTYQHTLLPSERALFDRLVNTQAVARATINARRGPAS